MPLKPPERDVRTSIVTFSVTLVKMLLLASCRPAAVLEFRVDVF